MGQRLVDVRDEIRAAYKRESLKTHPDRLPGTATPVDRRRATERFVSPSWGIR
jgi:curved DNA-binding protein CbpA